ncbi:MAG: ABC transporter ATP-binding protein [Proteobacteria bacterium]|jgi:branched-chain amino acid transport system ATP-binding protein|nr:ABC transporter ATP-binding protein [Pseudomonadota bacterium]
MSAHLPAHASPVIDPAAGLVELRDLHVHYGESHVLRGVSLVIRRGESVGLLGRNGMGKTTLIRALMGFNRASAGRVLVHGRDRTGAPPYRIAREGIAYVPEGRGIFPNLTVHENLRFAARPPRGEAASWTCERVLERFPRLRERLGSRGSQLSGGEQQMLAIGRALLTHPELLILDEATEGLAPRIVDEIWRIVGEIRASGIASLIVDRNYRRVLMHTDHAMVLEKGVAVAAGRSESLVRQGDLLARHLGV